METILKFLNSKKYYLILGYLFLFLGVFFVLKGMPDYYEMLFIISLTQFAIYYMYIFVMILKKKKEIH
jgi:hypothetical protein